MHPTEVEGVTTPRSYIRTLLALVATFPGSSIIIIADTTSTF
jgi:hypothetical protein